MTKAELEQLRETWRARVADFHASGKSGAAWCAANQVKEHQLWYWVGKFKSESTEAPVELFVRSRRGKMTKRLHPIKDEGYCTGKEKVRLPLQY